MKPRDLKVGDIVCVSNTRIKESAKFIVVQRKILGLIPIRILVEMSISAIQSGEFYFLSQLNHRDITWEKVAE